MSSHCTQEAGSHMGHGDCRVHVIGGRLWQLALQRGERWGAPEAVAEVCRRQEIKVAGDATYPCSTPTRHRFVRRHFSASEAAATARRKKVGGHYSAVQVVCRCCALCWALYRAATTMLDTTIFPCPRPTQHPAKFATCSAQGARPVNKVPQGFPPPEQTPPLAAF